MTATPPCSAAIHDLGSLNYLELTLPEPALNLALDEALLDQVERGGAEAETLRIWESPQRLVVLGRSSRIDEEADRAACRRLDVPILRRNSGGAAIVAGPGCLMYAVALSYERRPALRSVDQVHCFVLNTIARGLRTLGADVSIRGTSDLALGERKFSGNSLRCRRNAVLYHGTLLYDFHLQLATDCLRTPPRQPEYRAGRGHREFIVNLPLGREQIVAAVRKAWNAERAWNQPPLAEAESLAAAHYRQDAWNERH